MIGVDGDVWSQWVPEIVVEVVSRGSRKRDYDEKPDDYFQCGVREYWIIDPSESKLHALARSATAWTEAALCLGDVYESPLLPRFQFDLFGSAS